MNFDEWPTLIAFAAMFIIGVVGHVHYSNQSNTGGRILFTLLGAAGLVLFFVTLLTDVPIV